MKHFSFALLVLTLAFGMSSCQEKGKNFDASGSFEADETIISSEANGVLQRLDISEGQSLKAGQQVGHVDSTQLWLKKKQLLTQIKASGSRLPNIGAQTGFYNEQLAVYQTRLATLQRERTRVENLLKGDAATSKQLDDIDAQIAEVNKQMAVVKQQQSAQVSALQTQTDAIKNDPMPLWVQIEQLDDQLRRCNIVNPVDGTVLLKYAEAYEMTAAGKPLYKLANLSNMYLRAYITGDQLPQIKLNQQVKVLTDDGKGGFKETTGIIVWINDKAEFTPKTIQTKSERANLVYAIKVRVKNDGSYKIGMYGEVKFQ
jgi:HlyD family secretion protein